MHWLMLLLLMAVTESTLSREVRVDGRLLKESEYSVYRTGSWSSGKPGVHVRGSIQRFELMKVDQLGIRNVYLGPEDPGTINATRSQTTDYETVEAIVALTYEFEDLQLSWDPTDHGNITERRDVNSTELGVPIIGGVMPSINSTELGPKFSTVLANGTVRTTTEITTLSVCRMNFDEMPSDRQNCSVRLRIPVVEGFDLNVEQAVWRGIPKEWFITALISESSEGFDGTKKYRTVTLNYTMHRHPDNYNWGLLFGTAGVGAVVVCVQWTTKYKNRPFFIGLFAITVATFYTKEDIFIMKQNKWFSFRIILFVVVLMLQHTIVQQVLDCCQEERKRRKKEE